VKLRPFEAHTENGRERRRVPTSEREPRHLRCYQLGFQGRSPPHLRVAIARTGLWLARYETNICRFFCITRLHQFLRGGCGSGEALVAVGNYPGEGGRLHASSDGLGWPGNALVFPQALNGITYGGGRFVAVGENGFIIDSGATIVGLTNAWTKATSGNWEEPFWSLGVLPGPGQSIMITNAGWKAVAVANSTVVNHPASLTVESIDVSSPVDSFNTLLLNYAGLAVPVRIATNLRVETNSALVSYSSALRGANFDLRGAGTFAQGSEASFSGRVDVGTNGGGGHLDVSNAVLNAGSLALNLPATGTAAVVNLSGGSVTVSNYIDIGGGSVFISGGNFYSTGISAHRAEFRQSGGTNTTGTMNLPQNRLSPGQANYYLSGGTLLSSNLSLGSGAPGGFAGLNGIFEQSGGVYRNSGTISIWGTIRQAQTRPNGVYRLAAGLLESVSLQLIEGGHFGQTGGTNRTGTLSVGNSSGFGLSGGSLFSSNTVVASSFGDPRMYSNLQSVYSQTGGTHQVQSTFNVDGGGLAYLLAGWLTAPDIRVSGYLGLSGAAVTNSGTFRMLSGAQIGATGNYGQLGKLIVQTNTDLSRGTLPAPLSRFWVWRDDGALPGQP